MHMMRAKVHAYVTGQNLWIFIYHSVSVKLCLDALKKNLPREVAMQLATKWYTTHNAPGNSDGGTEWLKFAGCVLQMMGYSVNQLEMFRQVMNE